MKRFYIGLCLCFFISGCTVAPTVELKGSKLPADINSKPIAMYVHEETAFGIMTPGGAHQGLLGKLIENMNKPNWQGTVPTAPTLIAQHLHDGLSKTHGLKVSSVPDKITKAPSQGGVYPKSDRYSFSVSTKFNMMMYRPMHWQTYQYTVRAYATLRAPDGAILWQKNCMAGDVAKGDESLQLHMTEFRRDGGEKLRNIVKLGAKKCADELLAKLSF